MVIVDTFSRNRRCRYRQVRLYIQPISFVLAQISKNFYNSLLRLTGELADWLTGWLPVRNPDLLLEIARKYDMKKQNFKNNDYHTKSIFRKTFDCLRYFTLSLVTGSHFSFSHGRQSIITVFPR